MNSTSDPRLENTAATGRRREFCEPSPYIGYRVPDISQLVYGQVGWFELKGISPEGRPVGPVCHITGFSEINRAAADGPNLTLHAWGPSGLPYYGELYQRRPDDTSGELWLRPPGSVVWSDLRLVFGFSSVRCSILQPIGHGRHPLETRYTEYSTVGTDDQSWLVTRPDRGLQPMSPSYQLRPPHKYELGELVRQHGTWERTQQLTVPVSRVPWFYLSGCVPFLEIQLAAETDQGDRLVRHANLAPVMGRDLPVQVLVVLETPGDQFLLE